MLTLDKSEQVYILLISAIILNFVTVGWWAIGKQRIIYTSENFQKFLFFINIVIILISLYLLFNYKISNVYILGLLYYYIVKKIIDEVVILKYHHYFITPNNIKRAEELFLDIALIITRIVFLIEFYILYFIFFNNK